MRGNGTGRMLLLVAQPGAWDDTECLFALWRAGCFRAQVSYAPRARISRGVPGSAVGPRSARSAASTRPETRPREAWCLLVGECSDRASLRGLTLPRAGVEEAAAALASPRAACCTIRKPFCTFACRHGIHKSSARNVMFFAGNERFHDVVQQLDESSKFVAA